MSYIGPIAYQNANTNTGQIYTSISGSFTLYCNSGDTLSFYNGGSSSILSGNNTSTELQVINAITNNPPKSAQMCSITLL
jgi:hypothetical protein